MRITLVTRRLDDEHDNIGRYTRHLAHTLTELGSQVESVSEDPVGRGGPRGAALLPFIKRIVGTEASRLISRVRTALPADAVVWQYNPFLYGWKGLPLSICLFPLLVRRMCTARMVVVLHEMCFPFITSPRGLLWAVWQRVALWIILLGTHDAVVTSPARCRYLHRFLARTYHPCRARIRMHVIPVGANVRPTNSTAATASVTDIARIGCFYSSLQPAELRQVLQLRADLARIDIRAQLILVGAEDRVPEARRYDPEDCAAGVIATPYLPDQQTSDLLASLDLLLALYDDGLNGRRTGMATACAHGLCVIGIAGRDLDEQLFQHGQNCWLIPCLEAHSLRDACGTLMRDEVLRQALGDAARRTYEERLAWRVIARQFIDAVQ